MTLIEKIDKSIEKLDELAKHTPSPDLKEAARMGIQALKEQKAREQAAGEKKAAEKPKRAKKGEKADV